MRFADLNPVPTLDWLEPFGEDRFGHADLIRFGVPPKTDLDAEVAFSLTRRPAPYNLAPQMALANWGAQESRFDEVMWQLSRWLIRHLGNPVLLLWLVKQGGKLHADFADRMAHRLDHLAELELPRRARAIRAHPQGFAGPQFQTNGCARCGVSCWLIG